MTPLPYMSFILHDSIKEFNKKKFNKKKCKEKN